jgi:hypothetical protein
MGRGTDVVSFRGGMTAHRAQLKRPANSPRLILPVL